MWQKRKYRKKTTGVFKKAFLPILVLLILILIVFVIKIGLFNVKQIDVVSNLACSDSAQISNNSNALGQNFFSLNPSQIEDSLRKEFYCLKSIAITKYFPNKIKLQAFERKPALIFTILKEKEASLSALIESSATPSAEEIKDMYILDDEGVAFSKEITGLSLPIIYTYDPSISLGQKISSDLASNILKVLDKVKSFGIDIKSSLLSGNYFIINNSVKPKIVFNLSDQLNTQLGSLQLILAEAKINRRTIPSNVGIDFTELEFIDLRFDKPVIRAVPKKKN